MSNNLYTGNVKTVYVAGDLHGDYESFKNVLDRYASAENSSLLLFLGDYADRGYFGMEIIMGLNKLLAARDDIVALKGNHEIYLKGRPVFSPCDLIYEAETKYSSWEKFYQEIMMDFLAKLHIAAIINNVLFVHAGIFLGIKTAKDLTKKKNEKNLLWSDPSPLPGEHPSMRGAGITFGEDVTTEVLSSLGLKILIRSHDPAKAANGPCIEHGGKVITTNSCMSYGLPWKPFILKVDTKRAKYKTIFL